MDWAVITVRALLLLDIDSLAFPRFLRLRYVSLRLFDCPFGSLWSGIRDGFGVGLVDVFSHVMTTSPFVEGLVAFGRFVGRSSVDLFYFRWHLIVVVWFLPDSTIE